MTDNQIRHYSDMLIALILLSIPFALYVLIAAPDTSTFTVDGRAFDLTVVPLSRRMMMIVALAPFAFVMVRGLMTLRGLIHMFCHGDFFGDESERRIATIARCAMALVGLSYVTDIALVALATGTIRIQLGLEGSTILALLAALLLHMLAKAMAAGQRQRQELNEIV